MEKTRSQGTAMGQPTSFQPHFCLKLLPSVLIIARDSQTTITLTPPLIGQIANQSRNRISKTHQPNWLLLQTSIHFEAQQILQINQSEAPKLLLNSQSHRATHHSQSETIQIAFGIGKMYFLDHALAHLRTNPLQILRVMDTF